MIKASEKNSRMDTIRYDIHGKVDINFYYNNVLDTRRLFFNVSDKFKCGDSQATFKLMIIRI